MEFRISNTFISGLARLTAHEQKAVKTTAFDLQTQPSLPGNSFHKLKRAQDTNFWSLRVNDDIRIIVHRSASSILLAYVDHHDKAYAWAERRKIERHPATGAMQLVVLPERTASGEVVRFRRTLSSTQTAAIQLTQPGLDTQNEGPTIEEPALVVAGKSPFRRMIEGVRKFFIEYNRVDKAVDDMVLSFRKRLMPRDRSNEVYRRVDLMAAERARLKGIAKPAKRVRTPLYLERSELAAFGVPSHMDTAEFHFFLLFVTALDRLYDVIIHLPQEAQDAILKRAAGQKPVLKQPLPDTADPYTHPDVRRRFRTVSNADELHHVLEHPWLFLHPTQSDIVEGHFSDPVRVIGAAGTGKTIVALSRAIYLARSQADASVLLTTFSTVLANELQKKLASLLASEPHVAMRITVKAIKELGHDLYADRYGQPLIADPALIQRLISEASRELKGHGSSDSFLIDEWTEIVDARQIHTWSEYRKFSTFSTENRIRGEKAKVHWAIFQRTRAGLAECKRVTWSDLFGLLSRSVDAREMFPFDHVIADESQDLSIAELQFLCRMTAGRPNGLLLAGDPGQRIRERSFEGTRLGLCFRGRSFKLRINYRNPNRVCYLVDRFRPPLIVDIDGTTQQRSFTAPQFSGPTPLFKVCKNVQHEAEGVASWISQRLHEGCLPHEVGVFVRSELELHRASTALKIAGARFVEINDETGVEVGSVAIGRMEFAKGLEFRSVVVMGLDQHVKQLWEQIVQEAEEVDLADVGDIDQRLLYVACTRATSNLLVTGVDPLVHCSDDFLTHEYLPPSLSAFL